MTIFSLIIGACLFIGLLLWSGYKLAREISHDLQQKENELTDQFEE